MIFFYQTIFFSSFLRNTPQYTNLQHSDIWSTQFQLNLATGHVIAILTIDEFRIKKKHPSRVNRWMEGFAFNAALDQKYSMQYRIRSALRQLRWF